MNSKTPKTDEEWYNYPMSANCHGENHNVVRLKYARELEEENNSMRDIIKEAHDTLKIESEAYCSAAPNYLKETLSKLQSFLK